MQSIRLVLFVGALSLAACASGPSPRPNAPRTGAEHIEIARAGSQPPPADVAANFTGRVVITPLFQATEHTRAGGASVSFEPGARTAWHTHPAGQTLIVVAGTGWVQEWGGVKHWHGATVTEGMTHFAVQEHVDGKVVEWLEHVGEEEYRR